MPALQNVPLYPGKLTGLLQEAVETGVCGWTGEGGKDGGERGGEREGSTRLTVAN